MHRLPASGSDLVGENRQLRACMVWLVLGLLASCGLWLAAFYFAVPYQYSDGDTATWSGLLRAGRSIYAAQSGLPMLRTNYPPTFLWLVAKLAPSQAALLRTGALIAWFSLLSTMALVGHVVRSATGSSQRGFLAAGLCGISLPIVLCGATCLPDMLGLSLATLAVSLAALRRPGWPIFSALLLVAAVSVKHSLVVFPVGLVLWALRREPRRGLVLASCAAALLVLLVFGGGLFPALVQWSAAPFTWTTLRNNWGLWVLPLGAGIYAASRGAFTGQSPPPTVLAPLDPFRHVFAVALLWLISLGRTGSGSNLLAELIVATAVLSVAVGPPRALHLHFALTAIINIIGCSYLGWTVLPAMHREQVAAQALVASTPGPVLAEQTWYVASTGREPLVVPFLATQLAGRGLWNDAPLVQAAGDGQIALLLLGFPLQDPTACQGGHADRFPPNLLAALRRRYVLTQQVGSLYVYKPRP
jgi:hypothetical protein